MLRLKLIYVRKRGHKSQQCLLHKCRILSVSKYWQMKRFKSGSTTRYKQDADINAGM